MARAMLLIFFLIYEMDSLTKAVENMDNEHKPAVMCNEISNQYVYSGLSVERVTSGRLKFVRKFHKLFRFVDGYTPARVTPIVPFDFESLLTFSEEGHSMQTSGVSSATISLAKPWATAETSYEYAKSESSSSKKSYLTERLLCDKAYLSIDPKQIVPDYEFIQTIKAALAGKNSDVDKYQALVESLNEWGWYIPLEFTLGSSLYATEIKEVDNLEQAKNESNNFSVNFSAQFKQLAAGEQDSSGYAGKATHIEERIVFLNNGGSIVGKDNFRDWVNSLEDAKTWEMISFTKLYPSLMLLSKTEDGTLSDCMGVLRKFYSNTYVRNLQKYISVKDYEYEIAKIVSPVYD